MPEPAPPRVLVLGSSSQLGGAELMQYRLWRRLHPQHVQFDICFLDEAGPVAGLYQAQGGVARHFNARTGTLPAVYRALRARLTAGQFQILHLVGLRANLLGRLVAWTLPGLKVVADQRSIDPWRRPWHSQLDRLTGRRVSAYVANCRAVADWLEATLGVAPDRLHLIYSGLDPEAPLPGGAATTSPPTPATGTKYEAWLLCPANLRPAKDHPTLLRALARLDPPSRPGLLLAGDGPERARLSTLTRQLGLDERVRFLGAQPPAAMPALYAAAALVVLASRWEGLPGALMEGMALARPVVATAVGGVPELVVDGETGLLVPPGDPAALAAALAELLADPERRRRLGAAGQARVARHFNLDDSAAAYLALYHKLTGA